MLVVTECELLIAQDASVFLIFISLHTLNRFTSAWFYHGTCGFLEDMVSSFGNLWRTVADMSRGGCVNLMRILIYRRIPKTWERTPSDSCWVRERLKRSRIGTSCGFGKAIGFAYIETNHA
jgi:hypothetical protein